MPFWRRCAAVRREHPDANDRYLRHDPEPVQPDRDWLAAIYPRLLTSCAIRGMMNGLDALLADLGDGVALDRPELAVSFEELNDLVGLPAIRSLEQRFLTAEQLKAKYGEEAGR